MRGDPEAPGSYFQTSHNVPSAARKGLGSIASDRPQTSGPVASSEKGPAGLALEATPMQWEWCALSPTATYIRYSPSIAITEGAQVSLPCTAHDGR